MAPWGVCHTSFYGVRSFLWAVFRDNIVSPNLVGSAQLNSNARFQFGGAEYRGVLVLAFYTQTPSPAGLSAEILDNSFITEWSTRCKRNFEFGVPPVDERDQHWQKLAPLHRKHSTKWPDILHGPEEPRTRATLSHFFGSQQEGLLPSTRSIWRSAHCTEAATQYLSRNVAGVFAVAFEPEQPNQPAQPEASEKHKEKKGLFKKSIDQITDKMGTLRHGK